MSIGVERGRLLLKVCYQYYRLGLSHIEIANRLGISRFQVARLLRAALDDGYVTVKILEPEHWHADLEHKLERLYNLEAVIVVDSDGLDENEIKGRVADAAGRYVLDILNDGDSLGVSLGSTIAELVEQLPLRVRTHVDVVQLIGGGPQSGAELAAGIVATDLARRFRTAPYLLHAPAIVEDAALRDALLANPTVHNTYERYGDLNIALLGIGALTHGTTSRLLYSGLIDEQLQGSLRSAGAVGDVLAYVYDEAGHPVQSSLDSRIVGIPLPILLNVPRRIGVAAGALKTAAVRGALRGRFINVLVTDSAVAMGLVQDDLVPQTDTA